MDITNLDAAAQRGLATEHLTIDPGDNGFVRNSILIPRSQDCPIFVERNGVVIGRLDGYLVLPRETPPSRVAEILAHESTRVVG
jgi:hypothetical protein